MQIAFHVTAEFTALALLGSAMALPTGKSWAANAYFLSAGMLNYTVINSAGYFVQQGQQALVGMFALLLVFAVLSVAGLWGGALRLYWLRRAR